MHELVFPALNFTILVALLGYFLRKPVRDGILNRHQTMKALVEEAQAQKVEAERKYREFDQKLKALSSEAQEILERSRQDAKVMHEKILSRAHATAERVLKESTLTAQANFEEFKNQIRREAISQAIDMAERTIKERLSTDDQKRIVNEYVENCGKGVTR